MLRLDSASLSQILRGRRLLSPRGAASIAVRLGIAPGERNATVNETLRR